MSTQQANKRVFADSALDLLLLETINGVRKKHKDSPATAVETLDAIGFNIGRRLVEKCGIVGIVGVVASWRRCCVVVAWRRGVVCVIREPRLIRRRRPHRRTAQDRNRFNPQNALDVIKFLCKDFWMETFGKHVDNLRTNHRARDAPPRRAAGAFPNSAHRWRPLARGATQGIYVLIDQRFRWLLRMSLADADDDVRRIFTAVPCGLLRGALTALGMPCTITADASQAPLVTFTLKID